MKIEELYRAFLDSTGVCTDTRKLAEGNIFFSLKGENFNGNTYAKQAYENGAKYCVVDESEYKINQDFIMVDDVLTSLQQLAKHHRSKLGLPIIALTGSNGKTTTKELIYAVLTKNYNTVATLGNLNNHIGVPLTLLRMDDSTEIGIVEMGANHLKEIEFLSHLAEPNYGLITNFGKAHLEGFRSEENIVIGKSELFKYLVENDGTIIANTMDAKIMEVINSYSNVNAVQSDENNINQTTLISSQPNLKIDYKGDVFETKLTGKYNFSNIKYAIAIGEHFKVNKQNIISAISQYTPNNNRSQIIKKNSNTFLLDAYNANPSSMVVALDNFADIEANRKIAILGDMFELGHVAEKEHKFIADYACTKGIEKVILVGENFYKVEVNNRSTIKFKNFEDLMLYINKSDFNGAYFLIKGSRGMALERVMEAF